MSQLGFYDVIINDLQPKKKKKKKTGVYLETRPDVLASREIL